MSEDIVHLPVKNVLSPWVIICDLKLSIFLLCST